MICFFSGLYIFIYKDININNNILLELKEELFYDKDTGNFYWKISKSGRPTDRPAGTVDVQGYLIISYKKNKIRGAKLAWYFMTGDWPSFMIGYKDLNPYNLRWSNLKKVTQADRVARYKTVGMKLEQLNRPALTTKKVTRATFNEEDVSKAIEEYTCQKIPSLNTCVTENSTNPKETK